MTSDLREIVNLPPDWHGYLDELERCEGIAPFVTGNEVPRAMLHCGRWEKVTDAKLTQGSLFLHVNVAEAYHEPLPEFPKPVKVTFFVLPARTELAAIATIGLLIWMIWTLCK